MRGLGPIVENVAEVGVALGAGHCSAKHSQARVTNFRDVLRSDGLPETRPSGAGLKFRGGIEERVVATDAAV